MYWAEIPSPNTIAMLLLPFVQDVESLPLLILLEFQYSDLRQNIIIVIVNVIVGVIIVIIIAFVIIIIDIITFIVN